MWRPPNFRFGSDYLEGCYFEGKHLRAAKLDQWAVEIAKLLGHRGMKSHQLRRFFNKARGIQKRLEQQDDFEAVKADILSLKRDSAYAVGREVAPREFMEFIDANIECALLSEKNFTQGFMGHFESVLAYFVYYHRNK